MADEGIEFWESLSTGGGLDCETCGYTSDHMEYVEYNDGGFGLTVDWGCYDGAGEYEDPERAIEIVNDYPQFDRAGRMRIIERLQALKGLER